MPKREGVRTAIDKILKRSYGLRDSEILEEIGRLNKPDPDVRRHHGSTRRVVKDAKLPPKMNGLPEVERLRAEVKMLRAHRPELSREVRLYFLQNGQLSFVVGGNIRYCVPPCPDIAEFRKHVEHMYSLSNRYEQGYTSAPEQGDDQ